ncbi:MAG: hypothetical protein IPI91_12995 [Flavobacteriales bacterium]|nr:hypothetical protein [Flavobacteriales bacterium]
MRPSIHNIIAVDAGLGTLQLNLGSGPPDAQTIPCIIRRKDELSTLHVQSLGTSQRLRTGFYDLEVLTLPRLLITDVKVQQGKTTEIAVPRPGTLNILPSASGPGAIFVKRGDELEWVADMDPLSVRSQYRLLPGNYQVLYRSGKAQRTELSITKDVTIESGRSTTVNF